MFLLVLHVTIELGHSMQLSEIIQRQIEADDRRGFCVRYDDSGALYKQITEDLVGLMGELGEFANLAKKFGLTLTNPNYQGPSLEDVSKPLRIELADMIIYIIRLSYLLGGDLESDLLDKMKYNDERYRYLEK